MNSEGKCHDCWTIFIIVDYLSMTVWALGCVKSVSLDNMNQPFNEKMPNELMMGYGGAIAFVVELLEQILHVVDEYALWDNFTIVLTANHEMHKKEKGMWLQLLRFHNSFLCLVFSLLLQGEH